jgi:hypothetical protein
MATRVVSKTIDLGMPIEEISKYITDITAAGIQIHPKQWDQNTSSYIQIDGEGLTFWNEAKRIAQYGQDATIGDKNGFHIEITANYESYFLTNDTSVNVEKTYYVKNNDTFEKVSSPSGNPHENNYYEKRLEPRLSFYRDGDKEVAYISGDKLYITQSVVLQQMDVGTQIINGGLGQWSWKVHEVDNKNNLYLKWLG